MSTPGATDIEQLRRLRDELGGGAFSAVSGWGHAIPPAKRRLILQALELGLGASGADIDAIAAQIADDHTYQPALGQCLCGEEYEAHADDLAGEHRLHAAHVAKVTLSAGRPAPHTTKV